jgi:hypothetical protein
LPEDNAENQAFIFIPFCGEQEAKADWSPGAMTKKFDLNFHYYQLNTKYYGRVLQTLLPLFLQAGNIRSRIDPPDASCWPASDCGPEANPLRLMKDRQTGLMKKFPEQSGKTIPDRV